MTVDVHWECSGCLASFRVFSPKEVCAYLESKWWKMDLDRVAANSVWSYWTKGADGIDVPMLGDAHDYVKRHRIFMRDLARFEERQVSWIVEDMYAF